MGDVRAIGGFVIAGVCVLCATMLYSAGNPDGASAIAGIGSFSLGLAFGLGSSIKRGK